MSTWADRYDNDELGCGDPADELELEELEEARLEADRDEAEEADARG